MIWFIFIFGSLFLVIVLLNLLIAIMGDTFSRVLESIENLIIREKVMLISENESLYDRVEKFKHSQYLIMVTEKSLEGSQSESWEGQLKTLRKMVVDKIALMESEVKTAISESQKDMRKRFQD